MSVTPWFWGFKNSPQIMQKVMTKVLDKLLNEGVNVFMDDIIMGKTR